MDTRHLPARLELHPIPSLTLSDAQFLRGEADGPAVTLAGALHIAQGNGAGGGGRRPLVILLHGSGGIGGSVAAWVEELLAGGISALVLDGFTGRGLTTTSADQALLGRLAFCLDLYRALEVLARHPAVDPARIVVLGFSRGGQAALYAALARFHRLWNRSGITPAATIAFYPDCATTYLEDDQPVAAPIRIHHGTADDMNTLVLAQAYADRLAAAGHDVQVTIYAGAHHGFDNPLSGAATLSTTAQSVRDCRIVETAPGVLTNLGTGRPFAYTDPCVATQAHIGGHPEAGPRARRAVATWLADFFG